MRFLVGSHGNTEMKSFPVSLCPPLPLFLALCAGPDWPFGNCCSCLGCLTVAPICSDYMQTERTWCGTGWLPVANVLWHYPRQPFCFQDCLFSHCFYVLSQRKMRFPSLGLLSYWLFVCDQWEAFLTATLYSRCTRDGCKHDTSYNTPGTEEEHI